MSGREVIGQPAVGAAEQGGGDDARLLGQLAAGGEIEVLAGVDAALRELPVIGLGGLEPAAQPHPAIGVEQHHSHVRAVGGQVSHLNPFSDARPKRKPGPVDSP